ncbi:hypothetical protein [Teredinibacter turnerae]|uniref:hypothetical protein n=1 Tax=Teredinibacter turnerae TaxID=2426 RepID=UPI00036D2AB7|nr:hypothetical protein [Teredinibacter turnerae]
MEFLASKKLQEFLTAFCCGFLAVKVANKLMESPGLMGGGFAVSGDKDNGNGGENEASDL